DIFSNCFGLSISVQLTGSAILVGQGPNSLTNASTQRIEASLQNSRSLATSSQFFLVSLSNFSIGLIDVALEIGPVTEVEITSSGNISFSFLALSNKGVNTLLLYGSGNSKESTSSS